MSENRRRSLSHTRLHFKVRGHPFGIYAWSRNRKGGLVFRFGPLGHIQFQQYRCQVIGPRADNRRGAHGVGLYWWGVRGRRRKRGVEARVYL